MPEQPIDIQIFGRTLRINCPSQKKIALNKAAEDLDQRLKILKNKTKVTNVEQLVFIAALNVCHELFQEKSKTLEYAANIKKHIHALQQTINQALISHDYITENSNEYFECSKKTNTIK